jgi:carboxypeptidase PM20D1
MFDAHYDVVPVELGTEDDWGHPAFSGTVVDGYVWGRGAIDDKRGLIAVLEGVEALLGEGGCDTARKPLRPQVGAADE